MRVVTIAGVVLAAGASRRLGRPKQDVVLGGETLLERAVRVALEAGLAPVIVVAADRGLMVGIEAIVAVNEGADEGMASSIRVGVLEAKDLGVSGVVLMTCDQVAVTAEHLRALCAEPEAAAGSGYAGKVGVPAYFPAVRFAELLALRGDRGARALLQDARVVETEDLAFDVDTEEDVERARLGLRRRG